MGLSGFGHMCFCRSHVVGDCHVISDLEAHRYHERGAQVWASDLDLTQHLTIVYSTLVSNRPLGNWHWFGLRLGSGVQAVHGARCWHTQVRFHGLAPEWPHTYWTSLAKMLTELGYKVINISFEGFESEYVINKPKLSWKETYNYLFHSELFIGLSSGLSWFNWAMGKHTIMISGFTENDHEFTSNVTRVSSEACFPCWNNKNFVFDAGDWDWCPIWKGTDKQHICQKSIHPNKVFTEVKKIIK